MDIEGDCKSIESIVNKKASELTEDDKMALKAFQSQYTPIKQQLSETVYKAREYTGKRDDPSFSDFAKATAGMKRLLRLTKKNVFEVIHGFNCIISSKRIAARSTDDRHWNAKRRMILFLCTYLFISRKNANLSLFLKSILLCTNLRTRKCKNTMDGLIKRVEMLEGRVFFC